MSALDLLRRFPSRTLHGLWGSDATFGCADDRVVLTFDDGPDPEGTPRVLDALAALGARATFFLIGQKAVRAPALVRRIVEEGHAIGNHSWSHPFLPRCSDAQLREEVQRAQAELTECAGVRPSLFRPPYGWGDERVYRAVREAGLRLTLWSFDSGDYFGLSGRALRWRLQRIRHGDVVLLHDGSPLAPMTPRALRSALSVPAQRGLRFLTWEAR